MTINIEELRKRQKQAFEQRIIDARNGEEYKQIINKLEYAISKGYGGTQNIKYDTDSDVIYALLEDGLVVVKNNSWRHVEVSLPKEEKRIDPLQAENQRFRKALEEIASASIAETLGNIGPEMRKTAQAALKEGDTHDR